VIIGRIHHGSHYNVFLHRPWEVNDLMGNDIDERPQKTQGHSSEVLRRHTDGAWRYAIDHPFGGD
jgi:ketosteroid isomerase-like protein